MGHGEPGSWRARLPSVAGSGAAGYNIAAQGQGAQMPLNGLNARCPEELIAALGRNADAAAAFAARLAKLRKGLEDARDIGAGKAVSVRMPDGRVSYVRPEGAGRQRAAVVFAMREVRGFLARQDFDDSLLQVFEWVGNAASDAARGVPNPLFEPARRFDADAGEPAADAPVANTLKGERRKAAGRAPDGIEEDQWLGAAAAAIARRVEGHQKQRAAADEIARIAAAAGRQMPSCRRNADFDDRAPTGPGLLALFWKAQRARLVRPEKRKPDQTSRRVRYFELALRATAALAAADPIAAAELIERRFIAIPRETP